MSGFRGTRSTGRKTHPSLLSHSFKYAFKPVVHLFEDAAQGDGREAPYYQALNSGLTLAALGSKDKHVGVNVAPQYAFRAETTPADAGESTREDPVHTRATGALPASAGNQDADDFTEESWDFGDTSFSTDRTDASANSSYVSELRQRYVERFRTPDWSLWKTHLTQGGLFTKFPIAIVEMKPPDSSNSNTSALLTDVTRDKESAFDVMKKTKRQIGEQLETLFNEFPDNNLVPAVYVFLFVGKLFFSQKVSHGSTIIDLDTKDGINCLFDNKENDFSDAFKDAWMQMLADFEIPHVSGFFAPTY